MTIATLDGLSLPVNFSYTPYYPAKRVATRRTAGGVVTQRMDPQQIVGDGSISFNVVCGGLEANQLLDKYNVAGPMVFTGYWSDEYLVSWDTEPQVSVSQRLWTISGQFRVVCVTSSPVPSC